MTKAVFFTAEAQRFWRGTQRDFFDVPLRTSLFPLRLCGKPARHY